MSTFEVKLQGRAEVAEGTMAFHFEKPAAFSFKAGQAIDVVLPKPPTGDAQSARHTFSIVTAPFESDLVIATRMRDSAFKRALKSLAIGSVVGIEGPFGSLTLHRDPARPAVFIAGGIGITPFVSMLRQAAKDGLSRKLALLYSNRRPKDAAFLAELQELERRRENFRLIAAMTALSESDASWAGETGSIDRAMIERAGGSLTEATYYLAGPPGMVEAMRQVLDEAGVSDDAVRSEEFYGY